MSIAAGMVELNSIAAGIEVADAMAKSANIQIIDSTPACPGKYYIFVSGNIADVKTAVNEGKTIGKHYVVDSFIIANLDDQVIPAINCATKIDIIEAVGVVETFSIAASIKAADIIAKTANVKLIEVRLARGLGGKSFVIFTGSVGDVKSSVNAAINTIGKESFFAYSVVIPSPHFDIKKFLV